MEDNITREKSRRKTWRKKVQVSHAGHEKRMQRHEELACLYCESSSAYGWVCLHTAMVLSSGFGHCNKANAACLIFLCFYQFDGSFSH